LLPERQADRKEIKVRSMIGEIEGILDALNRAGALRVPLEKTEATVIALEDLIALKRGVDRLRDLDDISAPELLADKVEASKEHPDE